ncbi:hypothetical protein MKEN_01183000 [Mycena kentingensis (nom. inval.)]|nr:hypothetical protein MKEN_01183000 [Mycena kentingensis (nom. inval.)]
MRYLNTSSSLLLQSLSLRPCTLRQTRALTRFVYNVAAKEGHFMRHKHITHDICALQSKKKRAYFKLASISRLTVGLATRPLPTNALPTIATRRLASSQALIIEVPLPVPTLISPSNFPSPFTPANQLLPSTPFRPPPMRLDPKATPRRAPSQSPVLQRRVTDENMSPYSPESPVQHLTSRFLRLALPSPPKNISRRLSYSQGPQTPWSPEHKHGIPLASPALIRSFGPCNRSSASPRYELSELEFSPFQFDVLSF